MSDPIRVLCVFSTLDRGGAESMCMNLYRHIDRNVIQFDFVKHTSKKGAFEDEIKELGGKIYEAPRFQPANLFVYSRWWRDHLKKHPEHQIVHGHFFTISAVYFGVAKKYGRTTVGHIHASKSDGLLKTILCKGIEQRADHCFACSREAGKWLYPKKEFTVIPNALDIGRFSYDASTRKKKRDSMGIQPGQLVLGTVANLSAVKNPNGLLDIVRTVKEKHPDVVLLWAGEGQCRKQIEERIHTEKLEGNVRLLGTRSDVPDLLMAMDCFLLPSFNEGLPVSIIEAQTAGLMCYCSDTITHEVDVTSRVRFLPLGANEQWTDAILNDDLQHVDVCDRVRAAGYDINQSAKMLQDFYLSISN